MTRDVPHREVMNQIPILLIGKPGCSKSLAMGVLQNNLNGEDGLN